MPKPNLYICHTAYQIMIDMLRVMRSQQPSVLVMSADIPAAEELKARIADTGVFYEIRIFDEALCPTVSHKNPVLIALLQHGAEKRAVESTGFSLYPKRYKRIYIHNDCSLLGRYLQDLRAHYTLCEDTFSSTNLQRAPLLERQRTLPRFEARQKTGYGYLYWGDYKGVDQVETEDPTLVSIEQRNLVQESQAELLRSLSEEETTILRKVFITQELPTEAPNATLLMTRNFVQDGTMHQDEQKALWLAVVARYRLDGPLFIKTHPRDLFNYSILFPDAVILDRTMPSEVLNVVLPFRFTRAVTVQSTVLNSFDAADEKISLSLEEARALLR